MHAVLRDSDETLVSDDRLLVQEAGDGDAAAFARLLRRHDDKMRGVVWRLVESQTAMDDVLQDAYLKAWRALPNFRGDAAFSSWLYRIVYTTTLDHLRRVERRAEVPFEPNGDRFTPDVATGVTERFALAEALASLPPDQLAVVTLVDGAGETYAEVAALLGINEGTVASRLSRARAALRVMLDPNEGGSRER